MRRVAGRRPAALLAFGAAALALFFPPLAAPVRASDIERGEHLARAADCMGCHTSDPSRPLAGGYRVPTPFGEVYSTNITPDPETGIGRYTDDEFVRAVREGLRRDGADLYPAMPYDNFARMSRADVLAIKAFLFAQRPIVQPPPENVLPFPFNQRFLVKLWKFFNLPHGTFHPDPSRGAAWNRGAYLVEVLGHCGVCHTPRNVTLGMDKDRWLAGGTAGIWHAFNITPDANAGIGGWTDAELFGFLKTGAAPGKSYAGGPMAETVHDSLSHLPDSDISAIVAYLRTVPPQKGDDKRPRHSWAGAASGPATRSKNPPHGNISSDGAGLYASLCAGCHGSDGRGSPRGAPLVHNTTTGATAPENVVMTILYGVHTGGVAGRKSMAAFGDWLDDAQVSSLANYVFSHFGNPKVNVAAVYVREMRAGAEVPHTLMILAAEALVALGAAVPILLAWLFVRRRTGRTVPRQVRA